MGLGDFFFDEMMDMMHKIRQYKFQQLSSGEFDPRMARAIFEMFLAWDRCVAEADGGRIVSQTEQSEQKKLVGRWMRDECGFTAIEHDYIMD